MELNSLNIFKFIESKEGRPIPLDAKLTRGLPLTPEDLDIKGNISIRSKSILPDNLKVSGNLEALFSPITLASIPNNLQVYGDFDIQDSTLSDNFYDDGQPYSRQRTKDHIKKIRKMIEDKGGFVKGEIVI